MIMCIGGGVKNLRGWATSFGVVVKNGGSVGGGHKWRMDKPHPYEGVGGGMGVEGRRWDCGLVDSDHTASGCVVGSFEG
jgi:hypothetical protein